MRSRDPDSRSIAELLEAFSELSLVRGGAETDISDVSIDSRKMTPGNLFVAISGHEVDGHSFIGEAVEAGAAGVLAESSRPISDQVPEDVPLLRTDDTKQLIGPLASYLKNEPSKSLNVIGVAGTNGKTTTLRILADLAGELGVSAGEIGTLGIRVGDKIESHPNTTPGPETIHQVFRQMVRDDIEYCFIEVSSHGVCEKRIAGIDFDAGIFGNLSRDHLDYHGSMEAYRRAVFDYFRDYLPESTNPDVFAAINTGDDDGEVLFEQIRDSNLRLEPIPFGIEEKNGATDIEVGNLGLDGTEIYVSSINEKVTVPLVGMHNLENVVAAVTTLKQFGFADVDLWRAVEKLESVRGRLERIETGRQREPAVFVDYAHSPDSLRKVLELLAERGDGELTVVFGCGGDRDRTKRPVMGRIAAEYANRIWLTNDNPRTESPEKIISEIEEGIPSFAESRVSIVKNRGDAIREAISEGGAETIVLIAGKGHETYQEIGEKSQPFDDAEVAKSLLEECYE